MFGVAVLASVFAGAGSHASPQAFVDGFVPAVTVGAASCSPAPGSRWRFRPAVAPPAAPLGPPWRRRPRSRPRWPTGRAGG